MDGDAQGSIEGTEQRQIVLEDKAMMGFLADSRSRFRFSVTAWMVHKRQSILGAGIGLGSLPGSTLRLGSTATPELDLNYICSTLLCSGYALTISMDPPLLCLYNVQS